MALWCLVDAESSGDGNEYWRVLYKSGGRRLFAFVAFLDDTWTRGMGVI